MKNKVILNLDNGVKKEFETSISLERIKNKFSIGSLFITNTLPFEVGEISSMTCFSISDYKKKDAEQIKKNINYVRNLLK